ncbi:MAG: hypothetical protein U0R26_12305 [Solirubrobacterales bacterium]
MHIVTWNNHHAFKTKRTSEALGWLDDGLRADVGLLQEAAPPVSGEFIYEQVESPGANAWGTAVRSVGVPLEPVPLAKGSVRGGAVAAEAASEAGPVTFISVYGVLEHFLGTDWSIPNLHRIVSDLTPLLADPKRKGRIIIGGDLNADVAFDTERIGGLDSHSRFFDRIEAFGLKSVLPNRDASDQPPTWRRGNAGGRNDHLFVSEGLECSGADIVWDEDGLSDHAAIVVDVELPKLNPEIGG